MIQQIISHTPTYVWAILAFLVYRGVTALSDRETSLRNLFIIPAVMLYLSLDSMARKFGLHDAVLGLWALGAVASTVLTYRLVQGPVSINRSAGTLVQRGSWAPLVLMLAIFCSKYAIAVVFAMQPALSDNALVVGAVCLMFGLFNGVFLGRLLRNLSAWQRAAIGATPAAV